MSWKIFRRLFYFLVLLPIVTVAGAELVLRLFDPVGISYIFEAKRYFQHMEKDPDYSYRHQPNFSGVFDGVKVRTNSEGLRGPEIPVEKSPGEIRVLLLGDSVTFGWGVEEEDVFSSVLQQELQEAGHTRVRVINVAVGSWNTRSEVEYLRKRAMSYQPDILILVTVNNDIVMKKDGRVSVDREIVFSSFPKEKKPPKSKWQRWFEMKYKEWAYRSYVLATIQRFQKTRANVALGERVLEHGKYMLEDVKNALGEMKQLSKDSGVEFLVFLFGSPNTGYDGQYLGFYADSLKQLGVPQHTFPIEVYDRKYVNSWVDPHPNRIAHKMMGKSIFSVLQDLLPEKSPGGS